MFSVPDNALPRAFVEGDIGVAPRQWCGAFAFQNHQRRVPTKTVSAMFICQRRGNNGAGGIVAGDGFSPEYGCLRVKSVADQHCEGCEGDRTNSFAPVPRQQGIVPVIGIDDDQLVVVALVYLQFIFTGRGGS